MLAIRTAETHTITVTVTDAPDLPKYNGKIAIVPTAVVIEYMWQHPDHQSYGFEPGFSSAVVSGPHRLKSGKPGNAWGNVTFRVGFRNKRPDWLIALITELTPPEFAA